MAGITNRVKELRHIPAKDLLVNAGNWRRPPKAQQDALRGLLHEVGVAGVLLVYDSQRQGGLTLIDGHLRADMPGVESWRCVAPATSRPARAK